MKMKKEKLLFAFVLASVVVIFLICQRRSLDLRGYLYAGDAILSGADLYRETPPGFVTWPPFFCLMGVPFALLDKISPYLTRSVLLSLNFGALFLILKWISQLAYGRSLGYPGEEGTLSLGSREILLPLLFTFPYLYYHFLYHQVNLIIFALALLGLRRQESGRAFSSGLALGAAAALKVMPVLFLPYLAYRRRWAAVFWGSAATAAFSLSPLLVFGWNRFWHYAFEWLALCRQNPWGVGNGNQSVYAMLDRFLGYKLVPYVSQGKYFLPASGDPRVRLVWMLTILATGALLLLAFRSRAEPSSQALYLEWSIVFLVTAIFGPVGWKHYLVVLLLPNALLYAAWRSQALELQIRRILQGAVVLSFVMGSAASRDLVGKVWSEKLLAASLVTWASLIMLGALLWFRRKLGVLDLPPGWNAVRTAPTENEFKKRRRADSRVPKK